MRVGVIRVALLVIMATLVLSVLQLWASVGLAQAEGCPNEQIRGQEIYALRLPDCRAYEQVSPVDKNATDALGNPGSVESSRSGGGVTFFSLVPFPGVAGASEFVTYLSTFGGGVWSTQGLLPPTNPGSFLFVVGLTEDLSQAIISDYPSSPPLTPEATSGQVNLYLRDSATGAYRLFAPVPHNGESYFADATPDDSRILFESSEQLVEAATPGVVNLYEWDESRPVGKRVILVGVLPNGSAPAEGSSAGPGGPALEGKSPSEFYTEHTISENGARVFFSDIGTGQIYMREPQAETTIPVSEGRAYWRAATPDGQYVFYTEGEGKEQNLYRFDREGSARQAITSKEAGVLGTLGVSNDGAYIYFAAESVLAGGAIAGQGNLYQWHNGTITYLAGLDIEKDKANWRGFHGGDEPEGPANGEKSSRVTSDGTHVLFTSVAPLTSYNNSLCQGTEGRSCLEVYLYDTGAKRLSCISCNPSGVPATSSVYLSGKAANIFSLSRNAFLTRNLSSDGSRAFFQTKEALVPKDINGEMDVYEWERDGSGSCRHTSESFSASSGGCLYLISTGQSSDRSYFGDASADGSDVFFFTRQSLVGQDQDNNADLYDARIEGGIAAQSPSAPPAPCAGEGCRGTLGPAPAFGAPSSATFSGVGNLSPPASKPVQPKTASQIKAEKLAHALRTCRTKPTKQRRACESQARKKYGSKQARKKYRSKSARAHSAIGGRHS